MTGSAVTFDIVVAVDEDRGIGKDGDLPWRLPADLKHFRSLTQGTLTPENQNAVVMGRKTWDSIPERFRPLPGRLNVVLTRNPALHVPGALMATGIADGLQKIAQESRAKPVEKVFIIGGASIYEQAMAMPECRSIYLTRILRSFSCDTFFPRYDRDFACTVVLDEGRDKELDYTIELWHRRQ